AVLLLLAAGSTGAILVRLFQQPPDSARPAPGTPIEAGAPMSRFVPLEADFSGVAPVDGTGQPADMTPYRGKALLVNLWATWCAPCIKELPSLGTLQQELGGDAFQVVTIAIDERDPAKIAPFLAKHGATNLPVLIDRDRTIEKVAKVIALPTSLLVDREGKVKAMVTGDACWNSGTALAAVKAFIADGTVMTDQLEACG
ncbi:MAG TPA: TlpA disulfide reductase family protein, partial [Dongiaceae bacterium]|nr:TlpA disulfide reductase family protein [Dongiaceae bacterium]